MMCRRMVSVKLDDVLSLCFGYHSSAGEAGDREGAANPCARAHGPPGS